MEIIINLTDSEYKALSYVAVDPQEWIQNAASARANAAMQEIFQIETLKAISDPNVKSIPADIDSVVLASDLPSAADRARLDK